MLQFNTEKIASSISNFTSRYASAIITLLVLAGGFFFYFNVIVSQNEAELKQRSFRGLHRMATNITSKVEEYTERNAGDFLTGLSMSNSNQQAQLKRDYNLEDTILKVSGDTEQHFSLRFFKKWNLLFRGAEDSVAYTSFEKFTAPLLRRDIFTHYLLAAGDTILFDELNISHQKVSDFLSPDYARDSTKRGQIQIGEIREVDIGGKEFKLCLLSFIVNGKNKFTIGGYIPLTSYVREQQYIPTYALVLMVTGILLIILLFPVLKIFFLKRSKQLFVSNAISSFASLHVIAAIIVLIIINSYVYFNVLLAAADKNLQSLANNTRSNFSDELDAALNEINSIKPLAGKRKNWKDSIVSLQNLKDSGLIYQPDSNVTTSYKLGSIYPYFKQIVWTSALEPQHYSWTTNTSLFKKINIRDLDYLKDVTSQNLLLKKNKPYHLTAISLWGSNEKLAIISTPIIGDTLLRDVSNRLMVSLITPFRSMSNAILPKGYGICIVDENGDVLFDLGKNRSLNENLVEECTSGESLQSFLQTRSTGFTTSRYSGTSQRFYIEPIASMPFSIVTYKDMRTIWSENLNVITTRAILYLMNLVTILLVFLIIQIFRFKPSLLQNLSILSTWLRPNHISNDAYRSIILFTLISLYLQFILIIFYNSSDQLGRIGISFSYSFILLCYVYLQLAVLNEPDDEKRRQSMKPIYVLTAIYLFIVIIFLLNLNSGHPIFFVSQLSLISIAYLILRPNFLKKISLLKDKNLRWSYPLWIFSFMAATAIIPLISFYLFSFKQEQLRSLMQTQLEFANQFTKLNRDTLSSYHDSLKFSYKAPFYFQGFANKISSISQLNRISQSNANESEILYKKLNPIFFNYPGAVENSAKWSDVTNKDFQWSYYPSSEQADLRYRLPKAYGYFEDSGILISSTLKGDTDDNGKTIKENWFSFLLLFGMLLLFYWGFIQLLNALVKKIFFEGIDKITLFAESDVPFVESLSNEENIFVNGPVNSGKFGMMYDYLSKQNPTFYVVDLVRLAIEEAEDIAKNLEEDVLNEKPAGKKTIVLLRHFELFMNDLAITKKKLVLLELLLKQKKRVIILSSRSFDSMRIKEEKQGPDAKDYTDRWSNVMNQFYNLYHRWRRPKNDLVAQKMQAYNELLQAGLQRINTSLSQAQLNSNKLEKYMELQLSHFFRMLDSECGHSDFLWNIRSVLFTYIKEHKRDFLNFQFNNGKPAHMRKVMTQHFIMLHEQICLKIQSLSSNYYNAIWQSLNRDEQRALYNIALNKSVNPRNRNIAVQLDNLGLIKRFPDVALYEVMNVSFNNYLITQLDKKEVQNLQTDAIEKNNWNTIQLPVLLTFIAIGVFLFTTQKDAFTDLITYFGAAVGGIAALLKVLGVSRSDKN